MHIFYVFFRIKIGLFHLLVKYICLELGNILTFSIVTSVYNGTSTETCSLIFVTSCNVAYIIRFASDELYSIHFDDSPGDILIHKL